MARYSEAGKAVAGLKGGEILSRQVFDDAERVLFEKGLTLTAEHITRLKTLGVSTVYILKTITDTGEPGSHGRAATAGSDQPPTGTMPAPSRNHVFLDCEEARFFDAGEGCLRIDSRQASLVHEGIVTFTEKMLVSVLSNSPECTPEGLKENISQLTEQVRSNPAAMISLAHLKDVDNYTFMHSVNVSILAILLAERLGLKDAEVLDIATGAILHDIGKMRVDQTVLNKPGKLTDEEFLEMKNHPKRGFDILRERGFPEKVSIIALAHHEKMNGNGYPLSIDASRIPVPARICAIVDIYDALTADRVYKKAMHPTEAFEILDREAGQGIDEKLLEVFHNLLGVYPTSSLVLLADGSLARVIEQNRAEPAKPVVEVLHDRNGQAPKEILVVDTAKNTAYAVKRIFKE